MHYLELLRHLHETLQPEAYLEIGVDWGHSLKLSRAHTIAIDPAPKPPPAALLGKPSLLLAVCPSDDFFAQYQKEALLGKARLDLAFIDGLHQFAQVVRDLEHVERWSHPETVIAIHDVLPRNAWEAAPAFHDGFWTGDVWRIVPFLREHRPDLTLWLTAADPTGMLIVTGLDPAHPGMSALAEAIDRDHPGPGAGYDRLVEEFIAGEAAKPAVEVLRLLTPGVLDAPWQYDTKWGMRLIADSSWQPLLQLAADALDAGRPDLGLAACLRLIGAHWLPAGVREVAIGHLARYAQPLTTIYPGASWEESTASHTATDAPLPSQLAGYRRGIVVGEGAPFTNDDTLHAVTCWEPTEIVRIEVASETAARVALCPAPRLAERFTGASPGVSVPGGWLFLVNERAGAEGKSTDRFARFVFLRADLRVTAASPHFWLTMPGQDRAIGLIRDDDRLTAEFTSGNTAFQATMPLAAVLASLIPLPVPGLAHTAPRFPDTTLTALST